MGYLVGNGTNLYTRAHSLVHSPIYKVLNIPPDRCAYYPLAGEFTSVGGAYEPARGYVSLDQDPPYDSLCVRMGKQMRRAYCNVDASPHHSFYSSSNRYPDFIFYQGKWPVTSAVQLMQCEAYMQIPAYHFTIPSEYSSAVITGASLSIVHYGVIATSQRAGSEYVGNNANLMDYYAAEAPANIVNADSQWRNDWVQRIGLYQSLTNVNIKTIHQNATDDITLNTSRVINDLRWQSGDWHSKTNRDNDKPVIGNIHCTYHDDGIPITFNPWTQSVQLSSTIVSQLNTYKQGFIIISPNVGYSSSMTEDTGDDYPCYVHSTWGRWLCCSFGQYSLQVRIAVG